MTKKEEKNTQKSMILLVAAFFRGVK